MLRLLQTGCNMPSRVRSAGPEAGFFPGWTCLIDPNADNACNTYNAGITPGRRSPLAVLNIRNLPDGIHAKLRVRAAKAGRSMEAEAREIIVRACTEETETFDVMDLPLWVDELFGGDKPKNVVDELLEERRREAERE
jgi:hypothetical protein